MNNDPAENHHRHTEPGNKREKAFVSLASLVGAISLAWVLSSAWVGFRDGILAELAACSFSNELLSTKVEQYYRERDPWIERIRLLETQREQLAERLQGALDRIRDLERSQG